MTNGYSNSTAIITGGTSGIGRALAVELARRGTFVAVLGRDESRGHATVKAIEAAGGSAEFRRVDVTDAVTVTEAVNSFVNRRGHLDYMFNNAGSCTMGMMEDLSLDDWHRIVELNLFGVVHGIQAAYPVMIRQRSGHIVNVSSLAGLLPVPGSASYVATKFAVVGLSHALRLEAARHNVKVSVVCPASVETPIYETSNFIGIDRKKFKELVPGKPTSPEAFARLVLRALEKNERTITPGIAGFLSTAHKYTSWVTELLGRNLANRLAAIHTQ